MRMKMATVVTHVFLALIGPIDFIARDGRTFIHALLSRAYLYTLAELSCLMQCVHCD